MRAEVKMEITLYNSKGHIIAHDKSEREYETTASDYGHLGQYNKHVEELNFKWCAFVENDIY